MTAAPSLVTAAPPSRSPSHENRSLSASFRPFPRCLAASAAVSILWGLLLNAVWLSFYMGKNFWAWTVAKAPLKLLLVPVYGYLIYLTLRGLQKSGLEKHL